MRATSVETERARTEAQRRWSRVSGTHPASSEPKGSPGAARQAPGARQIAARTIATAPRAPDRPPGASTRRRRTVPESGNGRRPTPDTVTRPGGAHLGGGLSARARDPFGDPVRLFSRPRVHESEGEERAERQGGARPSPSRRLVPQIGRLRVANGSDMTAPSRVLRVNTVSRSRLSCLWLAWSPGRRRVRRRRVHARPPNGAPGAARPGLA